MLGGACAGMAGLRVEVRLPESNPDTAATVDSPEASASEGIVEDSHSAGSRVAAGVVVVVVERTAHIGCLSMAAAASCTVDP